MDYYARSLLSSRLELYYYKENILQLLEAKHYVQLGLYTFG